MDKITLKSEELQNYFFGIDDVAAKQKVLKVAEILFTLVEAKHPEMTYYNAYSTELVKDLYNLGDNEAITEKYAEEACQLLYIIVSGRKFIGQLNSKGQSYYLNHSTNKATKTASLPKAKNFIKQVVDHFENDELISGVYDEEDLGALSIPELRHLAGLDILNQDTEKKIMQVLKVLASQVLPLVVSDENLCTVTTKARVLDSLKLCFTESTWDMDFVQDVLQIDAYLVNSVFNEADQSTSSMKKGWIYMDERYIEESLASVVNNRYNDFSKFKKGVTNVK